METIVGSVLVVMGAITFISFFIIGVATVVLQFFK